MAKFRLYRGGDDLETFWVVDLRRDAAVRLGQVSQHRAAGSSFKPSPDARYGYNKPIGSFQTAEFFVCDLEQGKLTRVAMDGWPQGWWDARNIILKTPGYDFILYNVATGSVSNLLSAASLAGFCAKAGLEAASPASANLFTVWDGNAETFYITDSNMKWQAAESYLAQLQRPDGAPRLVWPRFKFEWSDHLDSTGRYYLYSGRQSGQASSAVFLRDLASGSIRTLVPDNGGKYFSLPNFYGDKVIYERSNMLWQIDLTGSNNVRLFPPPRTELGLRRNVPSASRP